jgi:hypothetical protein
MTLPQQVVEVMKKRLKNKVSRPITLSPADRIKQFPDLVMV